jgi:hypothetical protein
VEVREIAIGIRSDCAAILVSNSQGRGKPSEAQLKVAIAEVNSADRREDRATLIPARGAPEAGDGMLLDLIPPRTSRFGSPLVDDLDACSGLWR